MKSLKLTLIALLLSFVSSISFAQISAITGPTSVCIGSTIPLSDASPGGTWSGAGGFATVGATTGVVTGVALGVESITYTVGVSYVTYSVTVNAIPGGITGPSAVCAGSIITLSGPTGGTWSCSAPAVASVSSGGLVAGISIGTAIITYSLGTGCITTKSITVSPAPSAITGTTTVCSGSSTTLTDLVPGGVWSSSNTLVATAGSLSGIVTGVATGTATISYSVGTGCDVTTLVTVVSSATLYSVTGGGPYCTGGTGVVVGLSASQTGVLYQLYNGGTAVGSAIAGTGSSLSFGLQTAAGTYTIVANAGTSCATTMTGSATVAIDPLPNAYTVTGGGAYCAGGTGVVVGLSNSDPGVNYQLMNGITPVGSAVAGSGTALSFGLQTMAGTYTVIATDAVTSCTNTMTGSVSVTITALPTLSSTLTPAGVCTGSLFNYTPASTTPGTTFAWARSVVTGISNPAGSGPGSISETLISTVSSPVTVPYSYTLTAAGCSNVQTVNAMVTALPTVTATATTASCGPVVTLTAGGAPIYSWAPSTGLSCTSCGTATTTPASTVTYTVTGTDSYGCTNTATATVNGNNITGHITYTGVSTDVFTVWLIQFNPSDSSIAALDSAYSCMDAGVPYYGFTSPAAGNYLVKAKLNSAVPGTSGYIPTYSTSTPNWYLGTSLTHASSADIMDITMVYGTVPTGPGFISGYVYSGAGKGTTGDIPEPGMLVYLKDGSGAIVTYTYTDVTGLYSFPSLANGSYIIYPEDYKYYTTPSAVITLSPTAEIAGSIDFKKHTTFGTITPNTASILSVATNTGQGFYPNPTNGILNVALGAHATEAADVIVTSITGSIVYKSVINIDAKQAQTQIDLSALTDGMYFLNLRSGDINYSGKLLIVK